MKYISAAASLLLIIFGASVHASAQKDEGKPQISVIGIELANREKAEAILSEYGPTFGEDGRPNYFFYNKFATQVLKVTAASFEDPYFVTEIEVYSIGESYQRKHFQLKDVGYFKTEDGVFIGYKQSAWSVLSGFAIGLNNPGGKDRVGPKTLRNVGGEPDREFEENGRDIFEFGPKAVEFADGESRDYSARYEFRKTRLKRFVLSIDPVGEEPVENKDQQ